MRIYVTKADIAKGEQGSRLFCPIALSLERRGVYFEEINEGAIITDGYEDENSEEGKIPLPKKARDFIGAFDSGCDVKPFSFKIP